MGGCPIASGVSRYCVLQGNGDLKPETSVNKELGIQFKKDNINASLTWFRNDYKNKIEAGDEIIGTTASGYSVFRWENIPKFKV